MRTPIFIANWKMNKTATQAAVFCGDLFQQALPTDQEYVIAGSYVVLPLLSSILEKSGVYVAAQNMHFEDKGAFTGEVSGAQLADLGVTHVIIGHSERRQFFGEDNAFLNKKLNAAQRNNLIPIYCVGETEEQRAKGDTQAVVKDQIQQGLAQLSTDCIEQMIIAYEPVWAIGTGKAATPEEVQEVHAYIRTCVLEGTRIVYGGSVKPENAASLREQKDVDGFLIGGSSLSVEEYRAIVRV